MQKNFERQNMNRKITSLVLTCVIITNTITHVAQTIDDHNVTDGHAKGSRTSNEQTHKDTT